MRRGHWNTDWQKKNRRGGKYKPVSLDELIKDADGYDQRYADIIVHSLELYDSDQRHHLAQKFLSRKNRGAFHATNRHSKRLWIAALMDEFTSLQPREHGRSWQQALDTKVACALVTLIHEDWACVDTNIEFDLGKAKQKIRNALAGTNFICRIEAAPYLNEKCEINGVVGNLISFHGHAITWGGSRSSLDRVRSRIQQRFRPIPILGNESGVQFKALKNEGDIVAALVYAGKMPLFGKQTMVSADGKKTQRDTNKISYKTHRALFHALKKHDLFKFWLSGGREASSILRNARNRLKEKHKPRHIYEPSFSGFGSGSSRRKYKQGEPHRLGQNRQRPSTMSGGIISPRRRRRIL